jgi:anaerobic magnesium-protoporphyrin IX monomethyl ester cyclase
MLSILVGHSYFMRFDPKQAERSKPYPPLATLQLAALLRETGHTVQLFDAMLADGIEPYERQLGRFGPQLVILYEDTFNFLSKMCLAKMREAARAMITAARAGGARVIVAGPDVSDAPGPYLEAGADVALIGEGLTSLLELLPRIEAAPAAPATDWTEGVPGIATLTGSELKRINGAHLLGRDAGPTGPGAWDLIDVDRYRAVWRAAHGYFSLNLAASRGCSFRCAWCAKPIWGNQYLQRPAEAVAAEMDYLRRSFAPDHVWFADDIFGFRVDWVNAFTGALHRLGGGVPFTIQTRADLVSERMAVALAQAGCREAWLGAESGSQRVLDAMNKGTTLEQIRAARRRLAEAGIRVGFFIQLGYLGEELSDIVATRNLLTETRPDDVGVSVSYPLPGTRFYQLVAAQLGAKRHWQDSDDLAMMFQGTYTTEFYRGVRDLIHEQVSLHNRCPSEDAADHREARHLERKWQSLLALEHQHRTAAGPAAEAV